MKLKPRLLDLFCGAGGAAMGYSRAGFYVVGVDHKPQPRYAGDEFVQADALELLGKWCDDLELVERVEVIGERGEDRVGDLVGRAAVAVRGFDVQVDEDGAGHGGSSLVSVHSDSPKPAFDVKRFAAIHASPPCQAFTDLKDMHNAKEHEDLLTPTRELLEATGLPWIIENVEGAPMPRHNTLDGSYAIELCGSMFRLGTEGAELRRHRWFESNLPLSQPSCSHGWQPRVIGVYGGHGRDRRRTLNKQDFSVEQRREAMGIDWMNGTELSQAIPPAYTELIGYQLLAHVKERTAA